MEFTAAGSGGAPAPEAPGVGAWVFPFGVHGVEVLPDRAEVEGVGVLLGLGAEEVHDPEVEGDEEGVPEVVVPAAPLCGGSPDGGMG